MTIISFEKKRACRGIEKPLSDLRRQYNTAVAKDLEYISVSISQIQTIEENSNATLPRISNDPSDSICVKTELVGAFLNNVSSDLQTPEENTNDKPQLEPPINCPGRPMLVVSN